MNIVPNGQVILYQNIPLQSDYKITYWFDTIAHQENYFSNQTQIQLFPNDEPTYRGKFSYIRKGKNKLKIECSMQKLLNCNYMSFINRNNVGENTFENKTYYCFVEDIEYVNNTTTEITYRIDLMQTYLFDIELKQSFILRQHEEHDVLYGNLQPENIPYGEYESEYTNPYIPALRVQPFNTEYCIVIMYNSKLLSNEILIGIWGSEFFNTVHRPKQAYSSVYQGCDFLIFPYTQSVVKILDTFIDSLEIATLGGIISIFLIPSLCVPVQFDEDSETEPQFEGRQSNHSTNTWTRNGTTEYIQRKENSFNGYLPHNNKLYTFPYCYLYATNFRGSTEIYKYEYFRYAENSVNINMNVEGNFSPNPSLLLMPVLYKNTDTCDDNLEVAGFPICSYTQTDLVDWFAKAGMIAIGSYANSKGQNTSLVHTAGATTSLGSRLEKRMVGSYRGVPLSPELAKGMYDARKAGVSFKNYPDEEEPLKFHDEVQRIYDRSANYAVLPNPLFIGESTKGVASVDVLFGTEQAKTFGIYKMQIKKEFAKIVDDFFTMYGYTQNKLGIPNIHARSNWTYVQTENCYLHGNNMQFTHEKQIEEIFNKGITFWAYNGTSPIGDYSHPENNTELGG